MEVILMERIEKLGQMGDVVRVKPGFARNYLLPQRKALRATKENLAFFESQRTQLEAQNLERRGEAESVAKKLEGLMVTLIRQAGDSGQLYGSVNTRDVAESVSAAGVTVNRQQVVMDRVIKVLGLHPVKIRLHPEVAVTITANVARSEDEAKIQVQTGHMVSAEEQHAREEAAVEAMIAGVEAEEAAHAGKGDEAAEPADRQAGEQPN
ncbi:MAG: 50S ribosomal protein L9 [Kiloniellales bacterium]